MSRSAIAHFPEGAFQLYACIVNVTARSIVQGPAIGELLGGDDHTLARELQLVLQTVLVFLGPVKLFPDLAGNREQHVTFFSFMHHFLHDLLEDLVLLCESVQGLHGLLVEIVGLGICFSVLRTCGAEAPFSMVQEVLQFPQLLLSVTFTDSGALTLGAGAVSPPFSAPVSLRF